MSADLIVVRQLPIIEDQLRTVRDTIQARVDLVLSMECTEDTYKEVKKARSELNAQYRNKDAATDVLSFPMWEREELFDGSALDGDSILLGDIIISAEKAKEQSEEYGHSL